MGYKISAIIATDGSLGGDNDDNKLVENRKKETLNGLNSFGTPIFLNLPDGSLGNENIHTNIVKNSIVDPLGTEKRINEEVIKMFDGINTATK